MLKRILLTTLFVSMMLPAVSAQDPTSEPGAFLYQFELQGPTDPIPALAPNEPYLVQLAVVDASRDDASAFGGPGTQTFLHQTTLSFTVLEGDRQGWVISTLPNFDTYAGDTDEGQFEIRPLVTAKEPYLKLLLSATMRDVRSGIEVTNNLTLSFLTTGQTVWSANPKGSIDLAPTDVGTATISINHLGLLPRAYDAEIGDNPCGVRVVSIPTTAFEGKGRQDVQFSVQAPEEKFWYSNQDCSVSMLIFPTDNPSDTKRVSLSITVHGGYIDPVWIFNAVGVILAAIIIFFLIARRKARIEEEILGRPQKPWLIPVEKVYLEHLKERDPQAHYVVRHYLMEEEYQSSLLWYADFKKATKGTRAKERLVVAQEHKYERFQKRWTRRIAAPTKKADRFEARLQKKLDRKGRAGARKQRRDWKKLTKKMRVAHEKKVAKATEKWEKQRAKAEKKGRPAPEKPEFPEPDYPAEPSGDRILLAEHKWNKKATKFRAKQEKKVGNLEVKFEKKDAKMLRKVRRRVLKIARKLDDPEFASEHPLLAEAAE